VVQGPRTSSQSTQLGVGSVRVVPPDRLEVKVCCPAVNVAGTTQQPDTDWNLRGVA